MAHKDRVWARCHNDSSLTSGQFRPPALCELMLPNKVKQELTCPICLNVYEEAESLVPCGHTFCKECVGAVAKHGPLCPICKIRLDHPPVPAWVVRSVIGQQDVHCSNGVSFNMRTNLYEPAEGFHRSLYCEETMVGTERELHESTCGFKLVVCKWSGCAFVAIRSKMEAHEASCELKVERCTLCKKTMKSALMDQHVKDECTKAAVPCKNLGLGCTVSPTRAKLTEHLRKECEFRAQPVKRALEAAGTESEKTRKAVKQVAGAGGGKGKEQVESRTRPRTRSAAQADSTTSVGSKRKRG